ncbi:beta strand repeat-containing protein, partial [Nanoarchaeota archaeon]
GDLNVTGTSYLSNVTVNADNITVNEIHSKDGNLVLYDNAQNERIEILSEGNITFKNGTGSRKMTITEAGRVGIGDRTPTHHPLEVYQDGDEVSMIRIFNPNEGNNSAAMLEAISDDGTGIFGMVSAGFNHSMLAGSDWGRDRATVMSMSGSSGVSIIAHDPGTDIVFATDGYNERMKIDSDGNVGIGNSNPQVMLHIDKDQNAETRIRINNTNSGANAGAFFESYNDLGKSSIFGLGSSTKMGLPIFSNHSMILTDSAGITLAAADSSGHVIFATGGTDERMRIASDGKIGINNSNPSAYIDMQLDVNAWNIMNINNSNSGAGAATLIRLANDIGGIATYGVGGSNFANGNYSNRALVMGDVNLEGVSIIASNDSGNILFKTTQGFLERMRIDYDGQVGINTTSPDYTLEVDGTFDADTVCIAGDCKTAWVNVSGVGGWEDNGTKVTLSSPGDSVNGTNLYVNNTVQSTNVYIDDSNVGIGTFNPNQELDVRGDVNVSGTLYANNVSSNSPLRLQTGGTTRVYINDTTGHIGIGTAEDADIDSMLYVNKSHDGQTQIAIKNSYTGTSAGAYFFAESDVTGGEGTIFGQPSSAANIAGSTLLASRAIVVGQSENGTAIVASHASGNLVFLSGGWTNERMRVDSDGKVGINTTSPTHTLHVNGSANISGTLYTGATVSSGLTVDGDLNVTGTSYLSNVTVNADNITVNEIHSRDGPLAFYDNAQNERMRIASDGKVGIGTSNPNGILHLYENVSTSVLMLQNINETAGAASQMRIISNGSTAGYGILNYGAGDFSNRAFVLADTGTDGVLLIADDPAGDILLAAGGSESARIASDGKVGINTSSPTHTLNIEGDANISNNLYVGGTTNLGNLETGDLTVDGDLNVTGTSYLSNVTVNADNITVNEIHSRDGALSLFDNLQNETVRILANGNVGIGTQTPTKELEVAGDANVSGTLYANNVSSNSPLRLQTAGTTRIYINDSTGQVGIGTTQTEDIEDLLIVNKSMDSTAQIVVSNPLNGSSAGAFFKAVSTYDSLKSGIFGVFSPNYSVSNMAGRAVVYSPNSAAGVAISSAGNTIFTDGSFNEQMRIESTGFVGINTTSPTSTLHVVGDLNVTGTSYLSNVTVNADNITVNEIHSRDGDLRFYNSSGSEKLTILANGSVGIGTEDPSEPLDVVGNDSNGPVLIRVKQLNSGANSGALFEAANSVDNQGLFGVLSPNAGGDLSGRAAAFAQSTSPGLFIGALNSTGDVMFATGGTTERMRIASDGNIGINNSDPQKLLSI